MFKLNPTWPWPSRLGETYPQRVVRDVDAERAAFLALAQQCRRAAPKECGLADGAMEVLELGKSWKETYEKH